MNNGKTPERNEQQTTATEQNTRYNVGVVNNPCGAARCVAMGIEPEEFLSEGCASVCWDCWFVSQKIQL